MHRVLAFILILSVNSNAFSQDQWPQFRGPDANGHYAGDIVTDWSEEDGVIWKTAIHDRGWSSPVVWNDQVWLTTATRDGHKLYAVCLDKQTGKVIHDIHVFDVENPQRIAVDNSYATPTAAIQQGRIFVHFGTYGTACLDTKSGDVIWSRRDLKCDHEINAGPASSPMLVGNNLIVNVDGRDVQYVIAMDGATGKTVWKAPRSADFTDVPVHKRKAYGMPIVAPRGDTTQLISTGAQAVYSYDLKSGKELWKVRHRGWSIAPRPVYGHGMVFTTVDRDHPELWAIRLDGSGDITESHVVWKVTQAMPPRCSPLLVDDLLYLINRQGIASCIDAKTGEVVWKQRLSGMYSASPIYANGLIYCFNEESTCTVIKPGRILEVVTRNKLAEDVLMATPAVADSSLFIRTEKHLYRIGR